MSRTTCDTSTTASPVSTPSLKSSKKRSFTASLRAIDDEPIGAGLRRPHLAGAREDLAHVRAAALARKRLELLGLRVEVDHRVGPPVGEPVHGVVVHVDCLGAMCSAGEPTPLTGDRRWLV